MNGEGILTLGHGAKYVGNWKDDEKHGKGVYYWPDGDTYDGDWIRN